MFYVGKGFLQDMTGLPALGTRKEIELMSKIQIGDIDRLGISKREDVLNKWTEWLQIKESKWSI